LSSRPVPVPDAAARDLVAQTIIFKQNRHPWFLKTKENSFVLLHYPMFSAKLAGGFLRLIAKTLKLGDLR
jgi:hypothetical protein